MFKQKSYKLLRFSRRIFNIFKKRNLGKHSYYQYILFLFFLSRNKPLLESVVDLEFLDHLLSKSGLKVDDGKTRQNLNTEKIEVILEAQRCLSNIYLQCSRAQDFALGKNKKPTFKKK